MSSVNLLRIKKIIRDASYAECQQLAERALGLSYSHEVRELVLRYGSDGSVSVV